MLLWTRDVVRIGKNSGGDGSFSRTFKGIKEKKELEKNEKIKIKKYPKTLKTCSDENFVVSVLICSCGLFLMEDKYKGNNAYNCIFEYFFI